MHAESIMNDIRDATLACIVEPDMQSAHAVSTKTHAPSYQTIGEALRRENFNAVIVAAPTFVHKEMTEAAALAGKHVFCEKPMALSLREADEMISVCMENHVLLQIGFMRRFDRDFVQAKKDIENGNIGEVVLVKSTGRGPGLPPKWAYDPKTSLGMLAEVNSHDFDCIRWLGGSEFLRVYAEAETFKCPEIKETYPNFYDNAIISIRLKNRTLGLLDGSCPADYGYDARVEVLGTDGLLMVGGLQEKSLKTCRRDRGIVTSQFTSWRSRFKDAYIEEIRHFVECIKENKNPCVNGDDGKKALEGVLAATKSILSQRPVELPMDDSDLDELRR